MIEQVIRSKANHLIHYVLTCRVLRSLIPVTDRACDHEDDTVSPLYLAIYGGKSQSVELLLKEGFSPDAQDCSQLDMSSPLAFALSTSTTEPYRCVS